MGKPCKHGAEEAITRPIGIAHHARDAGDAAGLFAEAIESTLLAQSDKDKGNPQSRERSASHF